MKQELAQAVAAAVKNVFGIEAEIELSRPEEQFGDYATNAALRLGRQLGRNPRELAEELAGRLREVLADRVAEISIAGPGFINLRLHDRVLAGGILAGPAQIWQGQKILAEYSDPNPFKPLHAGHLYTTLVGDTIARLCEAAGAQVIRLNYSGDVGLHVGKSMWAIIRSLGGELPDGLTAVPADERSAWLGARYVEGNNAYEDDDAARTEIIAANRRVYQIFADNDHDSPFAQIYWTCRQWSYDYFKTLYEQLEIKPFDRYIPESEVTPLGLRTIRDQQAAGVYIESEGAVIFPGEKYGLHNRVFINSAGLPTYDAKDVGLLLTKWHDYHFDQSIVITANEQAPYYQVMLKSVEQFEPEPVKRSRHLTHGTVKLQGGTKMSSRKGNIVTALDILDAARQAGAETETNPGEETILAAVKYAFAKNRIGGDIIYIPRESIALEGNSGPYLQYAFVRARSILAKAGAGDGDNTDGFPLPEDAIFQPGERTLLRKISEHGEVVDKAISELMPHYICTYLYELAQAFNSFYEHNRVIDDPRQDVRLGLVTAYAGVLRKGLETLGIAVPDKM